jgi:hypothetical protein
MIQSCHVVLFYGKFWMPLFQCLVQPQQFILVASVFMYPSPIFPPVGAVVSSNLQVIGMDFLVHAHLIWLCALLFYFILVICTGMFSFGCLCPKLVLLGSDEISHFLGIRKTDLTPLVKKKRYLFCRKIRSTDTENERNQSFLFFLFPH